MGSMKEASRKGRAPSTDTATPTEPRRDLITLEEYYRRHGFLPPGYSIEVNGQTYHGGCHRWRAWADSQGYQQDPAPYATKREHDLFKRSLDEVYRPWM